MIDRILYALASPLAREIIDSLARGLALLLYKPGCANVGCKNGADRLKSGSADPYMG